MKLARRARPNGRVCALAALSTGLLLACLMVNGTALAGGGNSANAKLCQKGGWQELQTGSGGTFGSQDECVAFGAAGGAIFHPSLTLDPTHVPEGVDSFITVSGFHPSSTGDLTIHVLPDGGTFTFLNIPTTATGGLPPGVSTSFNSGACADGVTGAEVSFEDADGLHASAIVTLDCP
jgi:hypothetical protein